VADSDPYSFSEYYNFGVTEFDDNIYLFGGEGYIHHIYNTVSGEMGPYSNIYRLNLKNSNSLSEAQARKWTPMASLQNRVEFPAGVYSNGKLLIVGDVRSGTVCDAIQYLDFASNTTGIYDNVIDGGNSGGLKAVDKSDLLSEQEFSGGIFLKLIYFE